MSTFIDLMPQSLEVEEPDVPVDARPQEATVETSTASNLERFADEQIRALVRNLYFAGSNPCRQVVFSAVDPKTEVSALCRCVADVLSSEAAGATCILDADFLDQADSCSFNSDQTRFGRLRDASLQISSRLWYMPSKVFRGGRATSSAAWLKARLAELRLEFDYLVIQAAAGTTSQATLLAQLCDGLVLVVEANATRRISAQKVRDMLAAAHVRLLGTVLSERTFPIPRAIYERV
jgi:hypothetical protein